ncbi:acetate--CoA ligase family protein [Chelatococcus reniformis]|uniref:Acyl-CoA synthetase n=1 Tax=Chelatococcus reniformis TaxID=1494448 RepID=A0A916UP73_9HYPH|nr:acetate--CoA ligase family protein [Chelatococcus reniformis]GGC81467.1 acyl-CoA synthetase [Chelatococcus reniformis]
MAQTDQLADAGHPLDHFFKPRSIAVIGASPDTTKIRGQLQSMLAKNGYAGRLYPINPSYQEIAGVRCYASVAAIGEPVDLALIAIPAAGVVAALEDCAVAGVRHAVIITSGFAEEGGAAAEAQAEIAALARRTGLRVSGPNAQGFHNEPGHVAATFSPTVDVKPDRQPIDLGARRVGIVSQSGGLGFAFYNHGKAWGLNFSCVVSSGNEADLGAGDFFDYMVEDPATDVILLFLEGVRDTATFVAAAAKAAAAGKPVIVCKVGRSGAGERATASHTANMSGWDAAYGAVFARYGFIQAADPDEAIAIAAALTTAPLAGGQRAGIVTVSGGGGAWVADTLAANGLEVPELSQEFQAAIRPLIPSYGAAGNPIDVTAQGVHTGGLQASVDRLVESDEVDLVVLVNSLSSEHRIAFDVEAMGKLARSQRKPILVYSYTLPSDFARRRIAEAGLPVFANLTNLGIAARRLAERGAYTPPRPAAPAAIAPAAARLLADLGPALSEVDAKRVLGACAVPMARERLVASAEGLDEAMAAVGFPLVLKVQSPQIQHKSEVGGVRLAIADAVAGRAAYRALLADVAAQRPDAVLQGVLVSPMAAKGVEIIVGTLVDRTFGPMVTVGFGGVTTELFKDLACRPAPVTPEEAASMLAELKAAPLLEGFRGAPLADTDALCTLVAQVSTIAAALKDEVAEIELNPVLVHPAGQGLTIADALIVRSAPARPPA